MELRIGSKGNATRELQNKLNSIGFNVGVADGIFGQQTYQGVKNFQNSKGLSSSGIANQETIDKISNEYYKRNNSRSISSIPNGGTNMLTTYFEKIKSNKLYLGAAILGLAGAGFFIYKKVKK